MENSKKNLNVNCAVCDARNISEELLSAYDEVKINAATIITSPEAQVLLGRHSVGLNCAGTETIAKDVRFVSVNGPMTISANQAAAEEKAYLVANGPVFVEPGSGEALKNYAGMTVNGPVTCPESLISLLSSFQINGPVRTYPDGAILLKNTAVLDRLFLLRAKQDALYYAASRIIALAPDIDFGRLAEKNVRFMTKRLLIAESHAEAAVPLFDERVDIVILPDDCAYVNDDAQLDSTLVKRYGGKLFISGDLFIGPDSAAALDQVTFLRVGGGLYVCRSLKDQVLDLDVEYDDLYVVGGTLINGRSSVEVSAGMLENAEDGLSAVNCADVSFAEDISPELLKEKLVSIASCAAVRCTREQLAVVEAAARDVASICCCGEEDGEEDEDAEDGNTVQINAAFYTF